MNWREVLITLGVVVAALVIYDRFLKKRISRFASAVKKRSRSDWRTVQTFSGEPHRSRRVPGWVVREWKKGGGETEWNQQDGSATTSHRGKHFEYVITSFDGPEQGQHWGRVERKRKRK